MPTSVSFASIDQSMFCLSFATSLNRSSHVAGIARLMPHAMGAPHAHGGHPAVVCIEIGFDRDSQRSSSFRESSRQVP